MAREALELANGNMRAVAIATPRSATNKKLRVMCASNKWVEVWLELARDAQGELRENGNQLVFELR
jgi:hypothetical protein